MSIDSLRTIVAVSLVSVLFGGIEAAATDWPMLGRDGTRNNVSPDGRGPTFWEVEQRDDAGVVSAARGIRWSAKLGTVTFPSPVVSGGLVWIGTNGGTSSNSVLKCFRFDDGRQVYEYSSPNLRNRIQDAYWGGLGSSPMIEGDRLWLTTNRGEVLCLDIGPLIRGDGMPNELWKNDLVEEFKVFLRQPLMGPPRTCSIGASWNDRIFVTINNGVDDDLFKIPRPDAPSLVCLNKHTGEVYWKDNSPGGNILLTQLASPTVASIGGRVQVIVPQSDAWVRAFDPETGEKLWEFDVNPKTSRHSPVGNSDRNMLLGNAVVYEDRVYIASGQDVVHSQRRGRLVCIDPTKRGDVSSELAVDVNDRPLPRRRLQAVNLDDGEKAIPNPNSALIWEYGGTGSGKAYIDQMGGTIGSVAVAQGFVIATSFSGVVHCLDAKTGHRHWSYDTISSIWGSPLIVGDHVYLANDNGNVVIFRLTREAHEPLAEIPMGRSIVSTPIFVNQTLLIAADSHLFAIDDRHADPDLAKAKSSGGYWPQWRGPNRDNRSSDKGLLAAWPADGPPLVWRVDGLGEGIASVAVAEGRVFTSTSYGNAEYAVALDERTGERLWATRIGETVQESSLMRWLSQRTPTVDDNRVYAFTNSGWLVCLNAISGKVNWRISYQAEFGTERGKWGVCDRPLVAGDKLICVPGGSKATCVALDKRTGKVIWSNLLEKRESAAYGSGLLVDTDGLKQYVIFLDRGIVSFAVDDGRLLWRYDRVSAPIGNTYTPLVVDGGLFCPNGYQGGIARLKLTRIGDRIDIDEKYYFKIFLDPFQDSTALVENRLYAFQRGQFPIWINVDDGSYKPRETTRVERRIKAAVTYADGMLYVRWEDGALALLKTSTLDSVEVSRFELPEARKSSGATFPVVTGGHLYVRDNDRLYCFDVTKHLDETKVASPQLVQLTAPDQNAEASARPKVRGPIAIFVPTPNDVLAKMLSTANVGKDDIVYDLGSGDGRIVIEAARQHQCRAVGLEIDRDLVALSREKADQANVGKLVTIKEADFLEADFGEATVVTVYLFPHLLKQLIPKFERLKPGTRIVSHQFEIPDVKPEQTLTIESAETGANHKIYLWTIPLAK